MSRGTPHRPIRISDDLWSKAQAKAAQEGTKASAKVRELLENWIDGPHPKSMDEVTAAGLEHIDHCPQCRERFL